MESLVIDTNEGRLLAKSFPWCGKLKEAPAKGAKCTIHHAKYGEMGLAEVLSSSFHAAGTLTLGMSLALYGDTLSKEHLRAKGYEPYVGVHFVMLRFIHRNSAPFSALMKELAGAYKIDLTIQPTLGLS